MDKYERRVDHLRIFEGKGKYNKLFFLSLFLFFGPAGALWKSSGVTCYSLSGNWAENVNEYLSSWWGCGGGSPQKGVEKVQRGGC